MGIFTATSPAADAKLRLRDQLLKEADRMEAAGKHGRASSLRDRASRAEDQAGRIERRFRMSRSKASSQSGTRRSGFSW